MTHLTDLPPELLIKCYPKSHMHMLELALGNGTQLATLVLGNSQSKMVEWANNNLSSIHFVSLRASSLPTVDPSLIVRLTLIDPHEQLSALATLVRLTHLTIAFPTACYIIPPKCKLSEICPPGVVQITLMGAPVVVVDELPKACSSLSVTRCETISFQAPTRSLKELRLPDCKCVCLESLVNSFPGLESLSLDVGSVPYALLKLQSLKSLSIHLTAPPAGAVVSSFQLVELVLCKCF